MNKIERTAEQASRAPLGSPPIPREHGAWVILYAPMVLGFAAAGKPAPVAWLLITGTVTALFIGREAASLLIRGRSTPQTRGWAAIFGTMAALLGSLLLATSGAMPLLTVGAGALVLFGVHSALLKLSGRKRLDRSQWGEIIGVAALTLTAPAAYAAVVHHLDLEIALIWLGCIGYYSSGIFYVKMWLAAVKLKKTWNETSRLQCGRENNTYNAMLTVGVVIAATRLHSLPAAILVSVAYLPAIVRSAWGYMHLSPQLPPLKRVGMQETVYAVWFTLMLIALIHAPHL